MNYSHFLLQQQLKIITKRYVRVAINLFAPRYDEDFDLNVAGQLTLQSLAQCFKADLKQVKKLVKEIGDYGDVAVQLKEQQVTRLGRATGVLSLECIVKAMTELNSLSGDDSVQQKVNLMSSLFGQCQSQDELRYLVRSFANTGLRIGLSTKSVEKCVLDYFGSGQADSSRRLQDFEKNIFGYRIQKIHQGEAKAVYNVPIKCMVGRAAKDAEDVLKVLGKKVDRTRLVADFKYDGERTQLHVQRQPSGPSLKMFSRAFDSQNNKFWHLEGLLKQRLQRNDKHDFIVDGEIVYVDKQDKFLPFQAIERKLQTDSSEQGDQLFINEKRPKLFLFDILAHNDKSLCHLKYSERRKRLIELLDSLAISDSCVELAKMIELPQDDEQLPAAIQSSQQQAIQEGCEGIIVKSTDSLYETSGTRVDSWIKLKNVNLNMGQSGDSTIRDTLDLIPIGGFYGKGSRTGVFGSYLMAAYNRAEKRFECLCKLGTGFSQDQLKELHDQSVKMDEDDPEQATRMAKQIYKVPSQLTPDVWLKPVHIWEVQADSFTVM